MGGEVGNDWKGRSAVDRRRTDHEGKKRILFRAPGFFFNEKT